LVGELISRDALMPIAIKLLDRIAAEDVLLWPDPTGADLVFLVSNAAEFEAGTEGLALGFLSSAIKSAGSIHIHCEFDFPKESDDFCASIISSMFGYALLRACASAQFKSPAGNLATDLRRFAGRIYDERRGIIGLGDRVGIMAFDPKRPIPRAFGASFNEANSDETPLPSDYAPGISRVLTGMGLGGIASQSIFPVLMEYVFETFVNTQQHGRPHDPRVARHSTRGISITKIAFNVTQLDRRRISAEMREFLLRVADMERTDKGLFVACISVMDMGEGIQNTLPASSNEEAQENRLLRAFDLRETRKTPSSVVRGMGLLKVVEAAFRLGARLQVSSAGRRLVKDFSLGEDKLPTMIGAEVTTLPGHFSAGTCVDLLVPRLLSDIDQRELAL
jgi:hypothetical protein